MKIVSTMFVVISVLFLASGCATKGAGAPFAEYEDWNEVDVFSCKNLKMVQKRKYDQVVSLIYLDNRPLALNVYRLGAGDEIVAVVTESGLKYRYNSTMFDVDSLISENVYSPDGITGHELARCMTDHITFYYRMR